MLLDKVMDFSAQVRQICSEKEMEYIDAVIHWCDTNNIEVELAANLIKQDANLMHDIQVEAESLNYLKKISRLPV